MPVHHVAGCRGAVEPETVRVAPLQGSQSLTLVQRLLLMPPALSSSMPVALSPDNSDFRRLTSVGLVSFASAPCRRLPRRSSARDRACSTVTRITIAHVSPALAVDAACSVKLHASALFRLVQCDFRRQTNCQPRRPAQEYRALSGSWSFGPLPCQCALSPDNSDFRRLTSVGLVSFASVPCRRLPQRS